MAGSRARWTVLRRHGVSWQAEVAVPEKPQRQDPGSPKIQQDSEENSKFLDTPTDGCKTEKTQLTQASETQNTEEIHQIYTKQGPSRGIQNMILCTSIALEQIKSLFGPEMALEV
ncbi:hypothetical protein DUI87_14017 [Hirundo rustica rustica]|uniref:Uncharacterized protein n=1 Tax=Hirundo rustica rustica TaxID=333673 RepID=A0A3M0K785_HIRRU|nr:hypothetical protein DUI87_14017 [Hirundo rustica rustica]